MAAKLEAIEKTEKNTGFYFLRRTLYYQWA